jgi:NAD(P)-dependent dehydrogenase (short-subunit alcohol dehydrogenase family)
MSARFSLKGQIAVVTGASGGIGAAGAVALAEAGADVALVARNRAKLEQTARRVEAAGRKALIVETDVTNESAVNVLVETVTTSLGPPDILFNNAGVTTGLPLVDLPPAEWERIINVNLTGTYLCCRAFAPGMIARKRGSIINMGSVLSGRGMALRTVYSASKAGVANFGAALAFELGPHGITVNTIGATVIVTDLNRDLIKNQPQLYEKVLSRHAVPRFGDVEDVAGTLVFLASPAARFITGQTIYVDGGYTAG